MTIKTDIQAVEILKDNVQVSKKWIEARDYSKSLKALVNGEGFLDELVNVIEKIESVDKARARRSYANDVKHLFTRLFQPIETIGFATGDTRNYDIANAELKGKFISSIANIRDNKPLSQWVLRNAIDLINTDPNGVIFVEYTTEGGINVYPTYKSSNSIRAYKSKGQLVDWIIFEPEIRNQKEHWRIVCDKYDRTFRKEGNSYVLAEELSFEHPFGQVPAVICSDIQKIGEEIKISAIDSVIGLAKEYARDQSFLTLYKIYKGNPIFWRYVSFCGDCRGTGKQEEKPCTSCGGKGKYVSNDVTDMVEIPFPDDKETPVVAPYIGGFLSPDLEVWNTYNEELMILEGKIYKSHWGTMFGMQMDKSNHPKTATEIIADKQPLENQLNKYADYIEYMEWKISEWMLNLHDPLKNRSETRITIHRGRRYIIESYDVLLDKYEQAVKDEANSVILDKLFVEFINSKYRNNIEDLRENLIKFSIEPYPHMSIKNVLNIFGNEEAQRKILFQKYWQTVKDISNEDKLVSDFEVWFEKNKKAVPQVVMPINTNLN